MSWRSDPGSGPAAVSHVALDDAVPLATGYPWWPVASSVTALTVREDLGILAPPADGWGRHGTRARGPWVVGDVSPSE